MTQLDNWLRQATRKLAKESAAQVRAEIEEHYAFSRQAAIAGGATVDEADRISVAALGDAKAANCQYRRVLLTSEEARMLRSGNWESRAVCSRKWLVLALPAAMLAAAIGCFVAGHIEIARVMLCGAVAMAFLLAAPFVLPVYTVSHGRIFRRLKWIMILAMAAVAFDPLSMKSFWLFASCLWPWLWIEWTRTSIRRKLPVSAWPKQLYL
jgi:hypothetical protein